MHPLSSGSSGLARPPERPDSYCAPMRNHDAVSRLLERLDASLRDGTFVRLVLSGAKPVGDGPEKILIRRVDLKGEPHLSLTFRHATRDVTKNLALAAGIQWIGERLGSEWPAALLGTTARDWQLVRSEKTGARLISHKPAATEAPSRVHDISRRGMLDDSANDWLHGLGVTDAAGKVRVGMADKHRQIDRYLEILSHLAKDCGWAASPESGRDGSGRESPRREGVASGPGGLVFADMGCGKGYLTFGAWHLFCRTWRQTVRVIGVEARAELVATTRQVAERIGAAGLDFVCGTIDSARLPRLDALVALHACDTATDDALRRGIELGARLIVVAPCCHKELRPGMGKPEPFASVLRHGLMEERLAEWLTDGLRALFLEWAGYRTKLFEFVASEHTPKNLMIAAVRERAPFSDAAAKQRIEDLKRFFDVRHHALDELLARNGEPQSAGGAESHK